MRRVTAIGRRYGRLVVVDYTPGSTVGKRRLSKAFCSCDCGNRMVVILSSNLNSGHTKSCGCIRSEVNAIRNRENKKHGHIVNGRASSTYRAWNSMIARCEYSGNVSFANYGGRGISVCRRWRRSFIAFLSDMGERPLNKSIDRIDTNGNYNPKNCRWATSEEQARNRRNNVVVTIASRTACSTEWARRIGISQSALRRRLKIETTDDALMQPSHRGVSLKRRSRWVRPRVTST
jgi:hypothetical protein